ncbi:MAG: oxidoreductase [Planctomycetota bacterium]|nr:MAG: oxidoreductase [Planctomycetota bacterium]
MSRSRVSRRAFLRTSGVGVVGVGFFSSLAPAASRSANEKLNIACIGTSGQAGFSIGNIRGENIVALCDIDDRLLGKAGGEFKGAEKYVDFRKCLDQKNIDAVTVCTTDHTHAPASMKAIKLGKHVYCEKPLTHTVSEARALAKAAEEHKVATQMGTQIHAENNYRRVVELIQEGVLGKITEVHTWAGRSWGGGDRPKETPTVPEWLHWDLWLGPAPERPYHPTYQPANWRKWWDFGGGNLADMACHHMDLPFWALGLTHPTTVEAEGPKVHPETCPLGLVVRYEYPAEKDRPAVKLTWYDGDKIPREILGIGTGGGGNIFVGEKGKMYADYGSFRVMLDKDTGPLPKIKNPIPNSIGHHNEWIKACKEGTPTTCNFTYSGRLTEAVLLGNVAFRTGKKIEWDAEKLEAKNALEAKQFVSKEYRKGWEL